MATVLILTHTRDAYVPERVAEAVERRGHTTVRVDTDLYPSQLDMQLRVGGDGPSSVRLGTVCADDVVGVYSRRLASPAGVKGRSFEDQTVRVECAMHWAGVHDLMAGARWINDPLATARVEGHKLRQLHVATQVGLAVPPTLVTNDPGEVRAFSALHGDDLICKLLGNARPSMAGDGPRVFTRRLSKEDHAHLDALRAGPMCFQPRVCAREELRVAWVDGQAFVGRISWDAEQVDWRGEAGVWLPGTLDDDTHARLHALMQRLGLVQGAIDLMVPDQGPPVFLEVNPSGEWGMLEKELDLPISDAIARALVEAV